MNNFRFKAGDKVAIRKDIDLDKIIFGGFVKAWVEEFNNVFTVEGTVNSDSYKLKEIRNNYIHHNLLEKICEKPTTDPINDRFEILDL